MTTKSGQPTNKSGQKPKIKPCRDVVIEQSFELETLRTEVERLRNLLVATARALGLDAGDIDDIPQKAAEHEAEGSAACQAWSEKYGALQWDYDEAMRQYNMAQKRACDAEMRAKQTTENALAANLRWKEKLDVIADLHKLTTRQAIKEVTELETAIEAGRLFWQEYTTLADDLPDDMRGYFRQCSYLAGRFADALKGLEENEQS